MNTREKIRDWYEGGRSVFINHDRPDEVFIHRHWTSHVAHFLVACCTSHWKWTIVAVMVVSLIVFITNAP